MLWVASGCESGKATQSESVNDPAPVQPVQPVPVRAAPPPTLAPSESWNGTQIRWEELNPGLAHARKDHKPVVLVVYTDWCPHCKNYSRVFGDPRVVAMADKYVMIRVNQDQDGAMTTSYSPDGSYVPRTLFLTPEGQLRAELTGNNPRFVHFLDESRAESLLDLMKRGVGS